MKVKVFLLTFALMLTSVVLVGCTKTTELKTTQPTQSQTQKPTVQPTQPTVKPTQKVKADLAKPVISVKSDNSGVEVQAVEHATKIQVKVDDDQWADGTSVAFSTSVGEHVVKFKAVGNDDYNDSISDEFRYETKVASVSVTKSSSSAATLALEGTALKIDGEASTATEFSVTESGIHVFKAMGGWDNTNKKFYKDSEELPVVFAVEAASEMLSVFNSTAHSTAADMADQFAEIKKYESSGWAETTASVGIDKIKISNSPLLPVAVLNFWNNKVAFRYSLDISKVKDLSDSIDVAIIGNDVTNVTLQLRNTQNGVYATYDLGVVDSNACLARIGLNDTKWKVHWGENTINGFSQALSLVNMVSVREVLGFFDKFDIIVKGDDNNKATKLILGSVDVMSGQAYADTRIGYQYNDMPASFIATSPAGVNVTVNISGENTGNMKTLNLTKVSTDYTFEFEQDFTFTVDNNSATGERFINVTSVAKDANEVPMFTLSLKALTLGQTLKVVDAKGLANTLGLTNVIFGEFKPANILLDFEDGAGSGEYTNANWKSQKYTTAWVDTTGQMNSRSKDGSKVINVTVGGNTQTFTYTVPEAQRGVVDAFSVKMGNYWTANAVIKLKIKVTGVDGSEYYLAGSKDAFYEFKVTTGFNLMVAAIPKAITIAKVTITTLQTTANTYLYIDELRLGFAGFAVESHELNPEVITPTVPEMTKIVNLDFEDGAGSGEYTSANWSKKYSTDGGATWNNGGQMNSRTKDGSKVANMKGGNSKVFQYTYSTGTALGNANVLAVKIGNYYGSAGTQKIKIVLTKSDNTQVFVCGDATTGFKDIPYSESDGMVQYVFDEFGSVNDIIAVTFVIYNTKGADTFLYIDDLQLGMAELQ